MKTESFPTIKQHSGPLNSSRMVAKLLPMALCVGLVSVAAAVPAYAPAASARRARALYFQTNEPENSIVGLKVEENGTDAEVIAVSIANKTLVEAFNVGDWAGNSAQGMAIYP